MDCSQWASLQSVAHCWCSYENTIHHGLQPASFTAECCSLLMQLWIYNPSWTAASELHCRVFLIADAAMKIQSIMDCSQWASLQSVAHCRCSYENTIHHGLQPASFTAECCSLLMQLWKHNSSWTAASELHCRMLFITDAAMKIQSIMDCSQWASLQSVVHYWCSYENTIHHGLQPVSFTAECCSLQMQLWRYNPSWTAASVFSYFKHLNNTLSSSNYYYYYN